MDGRRIDARGRGQTVGGVVGVCLGQCTRWRSLLVAGASVLVEVLEKARTPLTAAPTALSTQHSQR